LENAHRTDCTTRASSSSASATIGPLSGRCFRCWEQRRALSIGLRDVRVTSRRASSCTCAAARGHATCASQFSWVFRLRRMVSLVPAICSADGYPVGLLFPPILRARLGLRLPLHVPGTIGAAALERLDVV